MASGLAVIVWCRRSWNLWIPFEPSISNYIESEDSLVVNDPNKTPIISIGHLSTEFATYEIDLRRHVLVSPLDGKAHQVGRHVCPPGSPLANNVMWEYEGNPNSGGSGWTPFDINTSRLIEESYMYRTGTGKVKKKGCTQLDLRPETGLPYMINFKHNIQTNMNTLKKRKIRRSVLTQAYVCATAGLAVAAGGGGVMVRKRKTAFLSGCVEAGVRCGAKGLRESLGHSVDLPRETRIDLGEFKGSNTDSVAEFLTKYTKLVVNNKDKAEKNSYPQHNNDNNDDGVGVDNNVRKDDDDDNKDGAACGGDNSEKKEEENDEEEEEEDDCVICLGGLSEPSCYGEKERDGCDVIHLNHCEHVFHKLCVVQMYKSRGKNGYLQCPTCNRVYGEKVGNCPAGSMVWNHRRDVELSGHEGYGALEVVYNIVKGRQAEGHPNPGNSFNARGFPRKAYLPDTDEGRLVLRLLQEAFRRRLMFTVGTSATTGESDTVIWNDIHHKTESSGNIHGHGYPDPNYLDNVRGELAAQGVTQESLIE